MFAKTSEVKVLRDPVHGYVHIDLQVIWDIVNSSWFQRLRRIRQLGGAYVVYHCAEHTRFFSLPRSVRNCASYGNRDSGYC